MKFDPTTMQFGAELELSDVDRTLVIPKEYGNWEIPGSERDIINLSGKYRGVAADPLGINPPVGGEINTRPTIGWRKQVQLICDLMVWLKDQGQQPAIGPTAHGHIHVHVPGLIEDVEALKRLAQYTFNNQDDMVRLCGQYRRLPGMSAAAIQYFKLDGGRLMPEYILNNLLKTNTFEEFTTMFGMGKDGVSRGRPFRYGVNLYSLKHISTCEFRMFRATLHYPHIVNSFRACELFLDAALNTGERFADIVTREQLEFAPMRWDRELWDGLQNTKHPEGRGKKNRRFIQLAN